MRIEDRDDFIDQVAQAVIDRIEERDRIAGMVEMVVRRVIELQREGAALRAAAEVEESAKASAENGDNPTDNQEDSVDEPEERIERSVVC